MGQDSGLRSPLLGGDVESGAADARISRVDESYVRAPQKREGDAPIELAAAQKRGRSAAATASACVFAAAILLLAAVGGVVVFDSCSTAPKAGEQVTAAAVADADHGFLPASRTGFHFQPLRFWMNDPNAPMFYKGYYHFFYQHNPVGAIFGKIHWGHAVSKDLINWDHLEIALYPDQWYDSGGVWSGSATILQDGTPVILYTGGQEGSDGLEIQRQCLATPVDPSDPLLRKWKKSSANPLLVHPKNVSSGDFRDPTTAWLEKDGFWRMTVGAQVEGSKDGIAVLYRSSDFVHWEQEERYLHQLPGSGMWECVDLFPVYVQEGVNTKIQTQLEAENYLDTYTYVLKASLAEWAHDHYALGSYSTETHTFTVDDPALDLGLGPRYDYGKFYASKTFFDSNTGRRVLWAWVNESDTEQDDVAKGWASVQAIPRTVWLDGMTHRNLLQWPVVEVESLRREKTSVQNVELQPSDIVKVPGGDGPQLDILIDFEKPNVSLVDVTNAESDEFDCGQGGAAHRGIFGPFGLLVLTDDDRTEQTGVFFYVSYKDAEWQTRVCSDQSRSSKATGLDETVYGSYVTILPTEDLLSMRVLVDQSIVETFVQGGRLAITSRVYPTAAIDDRAHVFLFNNGTMPIRVRNLDVFQMADAQSNSI